MRKWLLISCVILAFSGSARNADAVIIFQESFDAPGLPSGWQFDTDGQWAVENGELS